MLLLLISFVYTFLGISVAAAVVPSILAISGLVAILILAIVIVYVIAKYRTKQIPVTVRFSNPVAPGSLVRMLTVFEVLIIV